MGIDYHPVTNLAPGIPVTAVINQVTDWLFKETLVVTSKPNPPNPGHGYGFWAGDFHSTRTIPVLPIPAYPHRFANP